jgi:CheY-like chemotaxis protein
VETPQNMARRILVVDDEALVCDTIRRVLEFDHHEVKTTVGAEEAMAAFEPGKFDLIIVDYEMPAMKGDKLAAAIKAQAPHQPIIMITAYGDALRLRGNFPLGVDLVMAKPFDAKQFLKAVRQLAAKT